MADKAGGTLRDERHRRAEPAAEIAEGYGKR